MFIIFILTINRKKRRNNESPRIITIKRGICAAVFFVGCHKMQHRKGF